MMTGFNCLTYLWKPLREVLFRIPCTFALLLGWVGDASAEVCGRDLYLSTQAEVDALGANGCDSVLGYLYVDGYFSTITNLNGLSNVVLIESTLIIEDTDVTNLNGLDSVRGVLSLWLFGNRRLTDINGLRNLRSVANSVSIEGNSALTNITGLASLASVGGGRVY